MIVHLDSKASTFAWNRSLDQPFFPLGRIYFKADCFCTTLYSGCHRIIRPFQVHFELSNLDGSFQLLTLQLNVFSIHTHASKIEHNERLRRFKLKVTCQVKKLLLGCSRCKTDEYNWLIYSRS